MLTVASSFILILNAVPLCEGGVPGAGQALHLSLVGLFALLKRRRSASRTAATFGVAWWEPLTVVAVADLPLALGRFLTTSVPVFGGQVFLLLIAVQAIGMLAAQAIVLTQLRALNIWTPSRAWPTPTR